MRSDIDRKCNSNFRRAAVVATFLIVALASESLWAATSAYWRHEEGPAAGFIPSGSDTVLDSSGNGNHMETFDPSFTSATYSTDVSPLALRSGLPNTLSLDFGEGGDDPGLNDDNFTIGKAIHTQLFTAMTIELAFNMNAVGGFQTLLGKDGKPLGDDPGEIDSPVAPLQIKIRGDDFPDAVANQLFIEWIDGDGGLRFLATGESAVVGEWVHMAFTLSDTTAELWVAGETGDYALKDSITNDDFAGNSGEVSIFEPLGYSVGRGFFDNNITDWADAMIDEIRISDTALQPDDFLFVTVPATDDADFDNDDDIDGADFLAWQRGFGINNGSALLSDGDANGDGNVLADDLGIWQTQFGGPAPLAALTAVPEPTTLTLLIGLFVVGATTPLAGRRHRI